MISILRRLLGNRPETETEAKKRQLQEQLILEHKRANDIGRRRLEKQISRATLKYHAALDEAMRIIGE